MLTVLFSEPRGVASNGTNYVGMLQLTGIDTSVVWDKIDSPHIACRMIVLYGEHLPN